MLQYGIKLACRIGYIQPYASTKYWISVKGVSQYYSQVTADSNID